LQALPHPTSVRAGVVGFNLSPVLTLFLYDGSSEGIAGFLINARISAPLFESVTILIILYVLQFNTVILLRFDVPNILLLISLLQGDKRESHEIRSFEQT
jgi:hypothetical protein